MGLGFGCRAWKHSQYFLRQPDFLQWQPLLCRPTASLFAAPGAEWLILGRKAEGLRSSVCRAVVGGVRCAVGGVVNALLSVLAAAGCGGGSTGRVGVRGGYMCVCVCEARWPRRRWRGCLLDSTLAHLVVLWVVVAGLAVAAEAVLAGGEALTVQLQAARVAAVARLAQLGVLVLTAAAWGGWCAAFAGQPRRAAHEGGLAPQVGGHCRLTAGGRHEEKER